MLQRIAIQVAVAYCVVTAAHATDIAFDYDHCFAITYAELSETDDDHFGSLESMGIIRSNNKDKTFDNVTTHCHGIYGVHNKQTTIYNFCKLMSPDKDWLVYEQIKKPTDKNFPWKVLAAGGKWEGATGSGVSKQITKGVSVREGANAICSRHTGKLSLPEG